MLKEDIKEIKNEIKEEETFLLKLFQLEKFIRKYKLQLIIILVLVLVGVIGIQIKNYLNEQMLIKTNQAYNKLLKNPADKKSLEILQKNQPLYRLYLLQTSNNNIEKLKQVANSNGIIANLAKYELAVLSGDKNKINQYALEIDSIYKDLALLNVERIYLSNNNHKKAEQIVSQIKDETILNIANGLLHYGIVK